MKLIIVTTVPETLATILKGQPRWLEQYLEVVCVTSPGRMLEKVRSYEGVKVIEVPMHRGISPFKDMLSIFRVLQVFRSVKPDLVHSYTPKAGLVAMLAAFLAGVRVRVHTFTGLVFPTSQGIKRKVLIATDRLICAAATNVIPEGGGVAKDLKAHKITSKPLSVLGSGNISGVDTQYFQPGKCSPLEKKNGDVFTYCFIGRLNRDKGIQELVSAFISLQEDSTLVLVGALDTSAPIDDTTLKHIQYHPRIQATGFLEDVRPALEACDVLLLPSYREGFPNVVLQAGAMAKPVIATDINGCNEVIENDFNGWLVPPRDTSALAERMEYIKSIPADDLETLGNNARGRVIERYEQEAYRKKLLEFYRGLL